MKSKLISTQMLVRVAMMAAIAFILFKFFEIPAVAFYKLDLSGVPVLLAGFAMGPLAGIMTLAIKDVLAWLLGSQTGGIGELADFLMLGSLTLTSAWIYQRNRTKRTTLVGMALGTVLMIIIGSLSNYYLLIPWYRDALGMPLDAIIGMASAAVPFAGIDSLTEVVVYVTAPFNLVKGLILSAVTYYLYRYLGPFLKKGRI